jgi:hypothetical protein
MHEARSGRISQSRATLTISLLLLGCASSLCTPARATQKFGPLQLSGNIESQELVRHSNDASRTQFIQNRNTFRLRVDYDWLQNGKLIDRFEVPFIERSKLFLLYRGVYDGFYDIAPTDLQRGQTRYDDLVGGPISGNQIGQVDANGNLLPGNYSRFNSSDRSAVKWENSLREAYIDLKVKDEPLSFRIGRQQVIWGESDQFRIMDIWNPLDTSWHFQQESWDNIRVPLWLAKGLWDIGQVGPLSNTFLEVVYNAFDFQPGIKAEFSPRPWALPFADPLRAGQINFNAGEGTLGPLLPNGHPSSFNPNLNGGGVYLSPQIDLQGTSYRKGDFQRNPQDASEIGTRFHFVTPQGVEMSANYLYGRGRGVGAAAPFGVKIESINLPYSPADPNAPVIGQYQVDANNPASARPVIPIDVKAKVIHPYMHIFGLTGNYFEGDYTQAVFRFETAYAMGEPFQSTDPNTLPCISIQGQCGTYRTSPNGTVSAGTAQGFSPLGFEKRDVWTGMLGFDRPTWIKFLNPRATWFLSGQFFWNYTTGGHVDQLVGNSGAGEYPYYGPVGKWVSGPYAGQVERQQISGPYSGPGNGDQVRQWEHLITFAATSFYRGGTVVPFVANAWDPVNDNNETLWNVDYYYTNNLIFSLQQKFFYTYGSSAPSDDPWFAGGRFSRRDETGVKVTYQF